MIDPAPFLIAAWFYWVEVKTAEKFREIDRLNTITLAEWEKRCVLELEMFVQSKEYLD